MAEDFSEILFIISYEITFILQIGNTSMFYFLRNNVKYSGFLSIYKKNAAPFKHFYLGKIFSNLFLVL